MIPIIIMREKSRIFQKVAEINENFMNRNKFNTYIIAGAIYIIALSSLYYFNVFMSNIVFSPQIIMNLKKKSIGQSLISGLIMTQLILTLYFTAYP